MTQERSGTSVYIYLGVCFGFSFSLGLLLWWWRQHFGESPLLGTVVAVAYMFGPALGAVAAQRAVGEQVLAPLGVKLQPNRWWWVAWFTPLLLAVLALLLGAALPGVGFSFDFSGFEQRLTAMVPPEQVEEAMRQLRSIPPVLLWGSLMVQPLIAGATVNALAAFGEELGWRGYLFKRWGSWGFWRASWAVGATWGLWHAPLILQGHNYPAHPKWGVLMMVGFCILASPLFQLIRERTGSVWGAAILHGTINASAGLPLLFLKGGSDLAVGLTGLSGFIALGVVNLIVWWLRRQQVQPSS